MTFILLERASRWVPLLSMAILFGASGCSLIETTVDLPVRAVKAVLPGGVETEPVDPVDLQEDMLRFADNFVTSTSGAIERLQRDGKPIPREESLSIKITLATDVYGLASGSNALANLVSLTVLASGARWRVQDYWLPKVYGLSAENMLKTLETRESEIWAIAQRVLSPSMQTELRQSINEWHKTSGSPEGELEAFASTRLVSDVTQHSEKQKNSLMPSSVFALLDIDPLSGLDPATRELTETRLFAERALFMGQRMPIVMQWQMELLSLRAMAAPEVREMITGTSQIGSAADRLSLTMEKLPSQISTEREKVLLALKTEKEGLTNLSRSFTQTLSEGGKMATSTQQALGTFDGVLTHIEKWPSDPNSPPFDIKEYATTALEINRMSQRLTETLKMLQTTLNPAHTEALAKQVAELSRETQTRGEALINFAFQKILMLVGLIALISLFTGVLYQWLVGKIRPSRA
jgi:energy-converting hydrogenase Eha subunit E